MQDDKGRATNRREPVRLRGSAIASGIVSGLVVTAVIVGAVRAQDAPLTIADLARYRDALDGKPHGEPAAASFRAMWAQPERFQGKRVKVDGRVVRIFRQGAVGTFPPLTEAWTVSQAGDPLCLVFAAQPDKPTPRVGDEVEFTGTFLRLIPYEGKDSRRLAPLIVGDRPPAPLTYPQTKKALARGLSKADWAVGLAAGLVVVGILLGRHLKRPASPTADIQALDRPPEFNDES